MNSELQIHSGLICTQIHKNERTTAVKSNGKI